MSMKYEFHNIYGDKDKPVFNLCDMILPFSVSNFPLAENFFMLVGTELKSSSLEESNLFGLISTLRDLPILGRLLSELVSESVTLSEICCCWPLGKFPNRFIACSIWTPSPFETVFKLFSFGILENNKSENVSFCLSDKISSVVTSSLSWVKVVEFDSSPIISINLVTCKEGGVGDFCSLSCPINAPENKRSENDSLGLSERISSKIIPGFLLIVSVVVVEVVVVSVVVIVAVIVVVVVVLVSVVVDVVIVFMALDVVLLDVVDILFDIVDEVIVVVVVDVVIVDIVTVVVVGIVTVAVEVLEIVDSGVLVSDVKLSVIDPSEINQEL